MLNETFYLDGVEALSAGIHLQKPIEFSDPVPVITKQHIPGRNGDLIFDTGAFENRTGYAMCFNLQRDVERAITETNRFLFSRFGYRKLETSDDPNHYWLAKVESGARIEQRLRTLAPFELSFDCKPQRFLKSGESEEIEASNGGVIYNQYGFTALPLIFVFGSGEGVLTVGEKQVEILELNDYVTLDCETQNATSNTGNHNQKIYAEAFPSLVSGDNEISWSGGIERVTVVPRWWEL